MALADAASARPRQRSSAEIATRRRLSRDCPDTPRGLVAEAGRPPPASLHEFVLGNVDRPPGGRWLLCRRLVDRCLLCYRGEAPAPRPCDGGERGVHLTMYRSTPARRQEWPTLLCVVSSEKPLPERCRRRFPRCIGSVLRPRLRRLESLLEIMALCVGVVENRWGLSGIFAPVCQLPRRFQRVGAALTFVPESCH